MNQLDVASPPAHQIPYATPKQFEILVFIQNFQEKHGFSPSLEEIAKSRGVTKISIYEHINQLERKGWLIREKFRARSIRLLHKIHSKKTNTLYSCGAIQNCEVVAMDPDFDDSVKIFTNARIYRVNDSSLSTKGIADGDHLVVQNTEQTNGQLVLVQRNENIKIKSYKPEIPKDAICGVIVGI